MQTAASPRLAEDDAAALAALASQQTRRLADFTSALGPRVAICPHCRLGFGSASLQIHVRRCRALLPDLEAEAAAAEAAEAAAKAAKKPKKKLKVPSLVDLCLRYATRNFQAVCMDKVMTAPEHEAALIEALPTELVHRIITNLVYDNKQITEKEDKQRSKVGQLQRELKDLNVQKGMLEGFRHQATAFRTRLTEQDELVETMRRQLENSKNELAAVQQQNAQLQSQFGGFQKKELRLEGRINTLAADNDKLKGDVRAARKKEMEAIKLLASAAKTGKPIDSHRVSALQDIPSNQQQDIRSNKRPATAERRVVAPRPRTEGSKIPFPAHLPVAYAAKCVPVTLTSGQISKKSPIGQMQKPRMTTLSMGLLPRGSALVAETLQLAEAQLMEHRTIFSEVHQVLDEMVYDVETCERECEAARLKHELLIAKSAVVEYQERESMLIQERQQVRNALIAFDYALAVEKEGQAIMARLQDHLRVVMAELATKEQLEKDLAQAHEQLRLSAQLSKELANAQREIRELHRKNSIQKLLRPSGATTTKTNGNGVSYTAKLDRAVSSYISSTPRMFTSSPASSPVAFAPPPSNQLETALENDMLARLSDTVLMYVFTYLDANSVFAVNLTSRTMMTRVHTIFGMPPNSVTIKKTPPPVVEPSPPSLLKQSVMKARSQSSIVPGPSYSDKKGAHQAKVEVIAKSLNKGEIKYIRDMNARVKMLESNLSQVEAEKEDIAARLHSAESVRDFLMEKVKESEDQLSMVMEGSAKKEEQNAMDREIMGFLDARIQEYELTSKRLAKQNEELIGELRRVRDEHEAKLTIVHDMVTLLSDEKNDLSTQLKSQRKVLVREVKALRLQNEQLTYEKERYFTQLKQLRHALQHLDDLG